MTAYLPGQHQRAHWMRMDAASILKRFFFCERALVINQAGWIAGVAPVEIKTTLGRYLWQDAMTADALRERVFELRFPSRLMEIGDDAPLVDLFAESLHAPNPAAFLLGIGQALKPTLLAAYENYLARADEIADGPTARFLETAVREKQAQIAQLQAWGAALLAEKPDLEAETEAWVEDMQARLNALGGVSLEPLPETESPNAALTGHTEFAIFEEPVRDERFELCRYYWPDIVDPDFPYGEGLRLQLRSAVSHFNEVWAVETAGIILYAFAEQLGWAFIANAARWTYDEGRHCLMGYERLRNWGFEPHELPLGDYIFASAKGQDPVYRLGMLFFFETKNIGKKNTRIKAFTAYADDLSRHDMDYDWADETIHASYGNHWLGVLQEQGYLQAHGITDLDAIRAQCSALVQAEIDAATDADRAHIRQVAEHMIVRAEQIAQAAAA